jgi:hypothetical protein
MKGKRTNPRRQKAGGRRQKPEARSNIARTVSLLANVQLDIYFRRAALESALNIRFTLIG